MLKGSYGEKHSIKLENVQDWKETFLYKSDGEVFTQGHL
jgi:hypothetical protein